MTNVRVGKPLIYKPNNAHEAATTSDVSKFKHSKTTVVALFAWPIFKSFFLTHLIEGENDFTEHTRNKRELFKSNFNFFSLETYLVENFSRVSDESWLIADSDWARAEVWFIPRTRCCSSSKLRSLIEEEIEGRERKNLTIWTATHTLDEHDGCSSTGLMT